jgi:5-methylcytosine-specific restriction endonuclease McrA
VSRGAFCPRVAVRLLSAAILEGRRIRGERESPVPVLVLNTSLQPLSVIPERRLVVLLTKQKVAFVDDHVRQAIEEGINARQVHMDEPVIVQLLANVRVPRMVLRPTRANIMLRDEETCQYCGKRSRDLTLDHVLPRSRGGQSTWENLVACCRACNGRKGNRLLKDAGMRLIKQPRPLDHEYAGFFLLRYPRLREAYEAFLVSAQVQSA